MACKSGKRRYKDRLAAELSIATVAGKRQSSLKQETRSYECPLCKGWHVTSQETRVRTRAAGSRHNEATAKTAQEAASVTTKEDDSVA